MTFNWKPSSLHSLSITRHFLNTRCKSVLLYVLYVSKGKQFLFLVSGSGSGSGASLKAPNVTTNTLVCFVVGLQIVKIRLRKSYTMLKKIRSQNVFLMKTWGKTLLISQSLIYRQESWRKLNYIFISKLNSGLGNTLLWNRDFTVIHDFS